MKEFRRERERESIFLKFFLQNSILIKSSSTWHFFSFHHGTRHMELDFNDIKFYVELDFSKIEFQNMDISLNNLKRETNYYIFCKLGANAHFFQAFYEKLKVDKI